MRRTIFVKCLLLVVALAVSSTGCVYSKVTRPLDTNVSETVLGDKVGRASAHGVVFLAAWGDAGVAAAAKQGGLERVQHLDVESMIILFGLYVRVTTIAYGE